MAGDSAVGKAIKSLRAKGFRTFRRTFNARSPWPSITRLTVVEKPEPDAGRAITKTVLDVEPGAIRI